VAAPSARRPLPALVFLLGLSLLTALVWWRVIHRADAQSAPSSAPTTCAAKPSATVLPQPSRVTLQVLNSTERQGLAATTKTALAKLGFVVPTVANDGSGLIPGVAEIRYGPTGLAAAKLVAYYLPGATLVNTNRTDSQVVVSLGQKFTTVATATAAKAAMVAAHVSQSPVAPAHPTPTATKSGAAKPTTKTTTATTPKATPSC
jgi:cytoskeletal protein RodZ